MRTVDLSRLALAACVCLLPLPIRADVMKQTLAHVAIPGHTESVPLKGLAYRGRAFTAEITALKLRELPGEAADPVELAWVFTGRNTDGQMHRIGLSVTLVDESGADLASAGHKTAIRPGAKEQEITLSMSVPGSTWKAARRMRVAVNFY